MIRARARLHQTQGIALGRPHRAVHGVHVRTRRSLDHGAGDIAPVAVVFVLGKDIEHDGLLRAQRTVSAIVRVRSEANQVNLAVGPSVGRYLEEQADIYGFIMYNLGMKFK